MLKEIIHKDSKPNGSHYSAAVRDGNYLFISGQLPINPATGEKCRGSVKEQTLAALKNVERLIQQEGGNKNGVIRTTAYIADISLWDEVNEAYREFFNEYRPARSIVAVNKIHFDFLVEIEAIASLAN